MLKGGFDGGVGVGCCSCCTSSKVRRPNGVTGGRRAGSWRAWRGLGVGDRISRWSRRGRLAGEGPLDEVLGGVGPW